MTNKVNKEKMKKIVLTSITVLFVIFIWSSSLASGEESSEQSNAVMNLVNNILNSLHLNIELDGFIIRKMAHFLEFTILGVLLTSTFACYSVSFKNEIFKILFILLAVPVSDEAMQYISPNRGPQVSDVLLDFSGCITGLALTLIIITIIRNIRKIKNKSC